MSENLSTSVGNHQRRVGVERRERTRALLIRSAIEVFARLGPDAPVIEDFIAAAGVARGTFYNYFKTTHELLAAVTEEFSEEALSMVDPQVLKYDDPARRICVGTRLYVHFALRYPAWGAFLTRIGPAHAVRGKRLDRFLVRDLELGFSSGRFSAGGVLMARDMIVGSVFFGVETLLAGERRQQHIEQILHTVLQGLGLAAEEARAIAFMPLPDLGPMSSSIFATLESIE